MQIPAIILQILALIQLIATPENQATARRVWANARRLFAMLFQGGILTVEQQAALNKFAEEHEAAWLRGDVPPEFTVEPDPT